MVCLPWIRVAAASTRELNISKTGDNTTRFTGIQTVILDTILKVLDKPFEIVMPLDNEMGRPTPNGSWTGTIGEIQRGKADFSANYMTMTEQRLKVVDFSIVYSTDDLTFAIRKPGTASKSTAFLLPFQYEIWIIAFAVLLLMPLIFLFLLHIKSSYFKILLNLMGSIIGQYAFKNYDSLRYKIITFTWTLYGMILAFSYSAVLLSVLTVPVQLPGVRNFAELSEAVAGKNYKFYIPKGSSIFLPAFLNSEKEHFRLLGEAVQRNSWYMSGSLTLTRHPFIDTDSAIMYSRTGLQLVAGPEEWKSNFLSEDSFRFLLSAIPIRKDFCYKRKVNTVISRLNSAGLYFKAVHDESYKLYLSTPWEKRDTSVAGHGISCGDLAGAFLILLIGLGIAILCFIIEIIWSALP